MALGGLLATTGTALAAFQVVHLSMTSGEPGAEVEIRVDASQLIGGTEQSEAFLVPQDAYDASPEPARHRACWDNDCKLTTPVADPVKGTA